MSAVALKPSAFGQLLDSGMSKNQLLWGSHEPAFQWKILDSYTKTICSWSAMQQLLLLICPAALDSSAPLGLVCPQP